MSSQRKSYFSIDRIILYAAILNVSALLFVIANASFDRIEILEGDDDIVIATALSGVLLGLTIFYQVRQFQVNRFQSIFHHQMELHSRLLNGLDLEYGRQKLKGAHVARKLTDEFTNELNRQLDSSIKSFEDVFNNVAFTDLLKTRFEQLDHVLTPYFRHITSVLVFVSTRAPREERKKYPDYYLNLFSKTELRFFFYYSVYETKRMEERIVANYAERKRILGNETNLFCLFNKIDYIRYLKAIDGDSKVLSPLFAENHSMFPCIHFTKEGLDVKTNCFAHSVRC